MTRVRSCFKRYFKLFFSVFAQLFSYYIIIVVTVHPSPEITWFHNGQKIKACVDPDRYVETREKGLYSLQIKNCKLDDAGEVAITAKNLYGEDDCRAALTVQGNKTK